MIAKGQTIFQRMTIILSLHSIVSTSVGRINVARELLHTMADNVNDGHNTNTLLHVNDDGIDDVLIESTTETDCIDFG